MFCLYRIEGVEKYGEVDTVGVKGDEDGETRMTIVLDTHARLTRFCFCFCFTEFVIYLLPTWTDTLPQCEVMLSQD